MSSSPSTEGTPAMLHALLTAAAQGAIGRWRPLPEGATVTDLLDVDPALQAVPGRMQVLGQPATAYRWPATVAAPVGVLVWAQHDEITLVQLDDPQLGADPVAVLGPPDAVLASGLGSAAEQLLWPALGLIVHRAEATSRVIRIYGHHASTVSALEGAPLTRVRIERHPRGVSS